MHLSFGPLWQCHEDGLNAVLVSVSGSSYVGPCLDHLRVSGVAGWPRKVGRVVRSIVGHPKEGVGRQGIGDRGSEVTAHEHDHIIVERAIEQVSRKGSGRMANVDVPLVFISLYHEEDDERRAGGLSGYIVLANCLIGGRCPTNNTLQGRVIGYGHSPMRRIREVVRDTCGGHS